MIEIRYSHTLLGIAVAIGAIASLSMLGIQTPKAYASSNTWTGSGDGVNWSDPNNWSTNTIPADGDVVVIPTGFSVTMDTSFLYNSGSVSIQQGSTLTLVGGSNLVAFTGDVNNNGTIIIRDGQIQMGSTNIGATLTNYGTMTINSTGGQFLSDISIQQGAILYNYGVISNIKNGGIDNFGGITNYESGIINNEVSCSGCNIAFDSFTTNRGTINNNGLIDISGTDGDLFNYGTINNHGTLDNYKRLNNTDFGTIQNYGLFKIESHGGMTNDGQVTNKAGAELDNLGTIVNTIGQITNECLATYNGNAPIGNAVVQVSCDTVAPDTTITGAFDGKGLPLKSSKPGVFPATTSKTAKFFFSGSDNVGIQKFQCSLDSGPWTDCTSPYTTPTLQQGITHTFRVKAIDTSGNQDPTPATFTWKINPPKLK